MTTRPQDPAATGFSLHEVVFSMGIAALAIGGLITGHSISSQRAVQSTFSQAAQALALMRIEQTRATVWDPAANPPIDELVELNFPPQVEVLDLPRVGNATAYATNYTSITTVSTDPPVRLIRVDCVWRDLALRVQTNTVQTYRYPGL